MTPIESLGVAQMITIVLMVAIWLWSTIGIAYVMRLARKEAKGSVKPTAQPVSKPASPTRPKKNQELRFVEVGKVIAKEEEEKKHA